MKCRYCGAAIHIGSQVNNIWIHNLSGSMMCVHAAVPFFAKPFSKTEILQKFKKIHQLACQ